MANRIFTLEEAQATVPWLEDQFQAIGPLRKRANALSNEIRRLGLEARSNGGVEVGGKLEERRKALQEVSEDIEERVRAVHDRGILVKGIEDGLVDFPAERDGREVYLCWRAGEKEIAFWHETNTGFAGRQPL